MKVWCYFGPKGRVCADTDFKTPEDVWRVMLGWPTRGEVVKAKKRGDQVIAIDIRLPDGDAREEAAKP